MSLEDFTTTNYHLPSTAIGRHWTWWLLVALNIFFLLGGQLVGTYLGKLYFDQGGNSKWMATLVQSAGFPILLVTLFLFPSGSKPSITTPPTKPPSPPPTITTLSFIYTSLGLLIAGDNLMYSYGTLNLPLSTYSLICASQLAFNVIFSYFLNSEKITPFILNSVVLLTISMVLVATHGSSDGPVSTSANYVVGIVCTIGASATYSLLLSLVQLSFQRVIKKETFLVVVEMQIYTSMVASCACVVGLFASGEWSSLRDEMDRFKMGRVSYVMILIWTAVGWQMCYVGVVGLIFMVSSLFSNMISILALPAVPVLAVMFLHETMDGVKVMAMLLAIWGFVSYVYHQYLHDYRSKPTGSNLTELTDTST